MSQILVRNLDETDVARLKERAAQNGRSLEAEVRMILSREARRPKLEPEAFRKAADEFRARFKGRILPDSTEIIRQARDGR